MYGSNGRGKESSRGVVVVVVVAGWVVCDVVSGFAAEVVVACACVVVDVVAGWVVVVVSLVPACAVSDPP